jgi:DHA1 family bicyclomycin/chloramphenicol resistance-like MFS transporter
MAGMSAMTMNMFLPALPSMAAYFDVDYGVMQLSVVLFLAVNGLLQVFIGPISDRFGRRSVTLGGFAIFLVATIGCLIAPTAKLFLVFRMLQATIVAAMVLSRAVIRDVSDQENSASMIGYLTMGMAIIPMATPALGGFLDELFGWKANFWAFLILGGLVFALVWADMGETNVNPSSSFSKQFADYPELLTSPRFWGYVFCAAFSSGGFFAYLGAAPYVGSVVFEMTSAQLGMVFGIPALGYAVGNGITGRYSQKIGINRMILIGTFLTGIPVAASALVTVAGYGSPLTFFGFMLFVGFGNGFVMPNATAGLLSVRPNLAGTASGLGGAMMIGGGAGLSSLAGHLIEGSDNALPLLLLMLGVTSLGLVAITYIFRREKKLRLA